MRYTDFDKTASYGKLQGLAGGFRQFDYRGLLTAGRVESAQVPMAAGLRYSWAAKAVDGGVLKALQALAEEQELIAKYRSLLEGEIINTGEKRKVLHQLLRSRDGKALTGKPVELDGRNIGDFCQGEIKRFSAFAKKVHAGELKGATGKAFTHAAQIGIGGSDLGPRALYLALDNWAVKNGKKKLNAAFISNVDPDDASAVAASVDLSETIFILVSKSGTTQETLSNELFIKQFLTEAGLEPGKHLVAVTSETSPLANNPSYLASFYMDDFIGGRYSATSAVGGAVLSLAFGPDVFAAFLKGAHEADIAAKEKTIIKNAALLDALIGVHERNVQGYPVTAILPYSQALSRFPAHLQQADMESNGKHVNRFAKPIAYATGPVIFGEPGTNGQHSFYQLLHQGTDVIPLQFIGFKENQTKNDITVDGSTSQKKLAANLAAQIVAFALGKTDADPNKSFKGGRPSSLIYGQRLTPETLGALLAHYENKIMFQGFLWNVNSFDQEGVQLGKILTKQVLTGKMDGALKEYALLLGV